VIQVVVAFQCTKSECEAALENSSRNKSGSEIIWCVSKGRCVTGRSDATIRAAVERLGTNEVPIHHSNVNPIRFRFGDPLAKRANFLPCFISLP